MRKRHLILLFLLGITSPLVARPSLSYTSTSVVEAATNDGSINNSTPITATLAGDTFLGADGDDFFATGAVYFENLPDGLTPVVTRLNPTQLQITFAGHASNHTNADDLTDVVMHFYDRFTNSTANEVEKSSQAFSVNFNDPVLIAYDGFDYIAGTAVATSATAGSNGGTGWAAPWRTNSLNGIWVANAGLNYQKLLVGGKSATAMGSAAGQGQVWRGIPGGFGGAGNTHWVSFLLTKNINTSNGGMRMGLTDSATTPIIQANIIANPSTGKWESTVVSGTGYTTAWRAGWDRVIAGGTTLVIARIVVNTSTTISYWINPADYRTVTGLGAADITFANPAALSFPFFQFYARNSTSVNAIAFDELRVGADLGAVTPYDPNAPELVLSKTSLSVHEASGVDTVGVSLIAAPTANVIVDATCANSNIATVSPTQLTFTPGNWATPQTFTVTAQNDSTLRVKNTTLTLSVNAASAPAYAALGNKQLAVKHYNDDVLAVVSEQSAISITDDATADLRFKLSAQPLGDTVVNASIEPVLQPKTALKVLMVGNSYAAGFSPELQSLIAADPSLSLTFGSAIFGGKTLTNHYDNRMALYYGGTKSLDGLLDEQAWDCVILQENSTGPTSVDNATPAFLAAAKNLSAFIAQKMNNGINDNPAVKIYYLMTPAHHENSVYMTGGYSPEAMQKEVRDACYSVANDPLCAGTVIPVGNAFERAYTQRGYNGITLHNLPDTTHHSISGKYLGAAVMARTLFQRDLISNTYVPVGLTQQEVDYLKGVAAEVVKLSPGTAYNADFSITGSTSFTFTPANWDTWQTVTLQAAAGSAGRYSTCKLRLRGDALVIDALPAISAASSSGPSFTYQSWLQANNLPLNGTNDGAPDASPSGDGVANALKFALGLGAGDVGYAGRLDSEILNVTGAEYLALTYIRPEPVPFGVGYAVKVSDDLTTWTAEQTVEVYSDVADGLRTITVRDTVGIGPSAPRRFIRLEVGLASLPSIISQPGSASFSPGSPVTLGVAANGFPAPTYQWYKGSPPGGVPIPGATNATYTIPYPQFGDGGYYYAVISNVAGSITSSIASLFTPPIISSQPLSAGFSLGSRVSLGVSCNGFPAPEYQWYKGTPPAGNPLVAANSPTYTIASAQLDDAGDYYVVAANTAGSVTSSVASLSSIPLITSQPVSKGFAVGNAVSLTVVAVGSPAPAYQWYKGTPPAGVPIPGATSSTFSIASPQTGDSGDYYVVAANAGGSATSSAATLTAGLPVITVQPVNVITSLGAEVRGLVAASGNAPLTYQWYKGTPGSGVALTSATNASVRLSATASATGSDAGNYYVVVSNGLGSTTSNIINVSLITLGAALDSPSQAFITTSTSSGSSYARPWFVVSDFTHYGSASVRSGRLYDNTKSTMTTTVTGPTSLSFWWKVSSAANVNYLSFYVDDVLIDRISGTVDWAKKSHTISAPGNHTLKWEIGGNLSVGRIDQFIIGATNIPPGISSHPLSRTVPTNTSVTLSVVATGSPAPSYQWSKNGTSIGGATSASYLIPNAQLGDSGNYSVTVSNPSGSVTSNTATLQVLDPVAPTVTTQPVGQTVEKGGTAIFSVVATGFPSPAYQWSKNGTIIANATGNSYSIENAQEDDAGNYSVSVANSAGTVTSNLANLFVTTPPFITTQPMSQSVAAGTEITLSVLATGSPAPTYQWSRNGTSIAGATSASYMIASGQVSDSGNYSVTATNIYGTVTSSAAQLTVFDPSLPVITSQPTKKTVNYGTELKFGVTYDSATNVSFQWYREDALIPGANKFFYSVASATTADAGNYHVVLTNASGSVSSDKVYQTVISNHPTITTQPTSKTVFQGGTATFTVVSAGIPEPSYSWYKVGNPTPIAGANGSTLTLTSVDASSAGGYYVTLANVIGTQTSTTANLTVDASLRAPIITSQPADRQVFLGDSVTFSVVANGNPSAMTYQWMLNDANISGANSATYTIPSCSAGHLGTYTVVVTNTQGSETSNPAVLSQYPAGTLLLTQGSTARCVIVATTGLSPSEETAKTDLKKYLERMSGATIPILTPAESLSSNQTKIILGQKTVLEMFPAQYPAGSFTALGKDGFILKTIGSSLLVAGGEKRGTMYAAFDLLERLGCRWWAVGASHIPSKSQLAVVPLDERQVPALEFRDMLYGDRPNLGTVNGFEENGNQLYIHNKVNGFNYKTNPESLGGKWDFDGNLVHTWHSLMAPVEIDGVLVDGSYEAHPEYYAERSPGVYNSGQVNPLHPMVFQIMLANVRKLLTANPNYEFVVVGQEDNSNYCKCAECVAMATAEGTYNAPGLDLGNRIADVVAAEFPGKWVMVPAYTWSRTPPLTMRPRSNVGIVLCSIECDFNRPLGDASTPKNLAFANDIVAWGEIAPKLYIWDYTTNFDHYLAPFPNFDAMVPNIKWFIEHGVKGILEQGSSSTAGAEFAKLRMWVLARALWNGGNYPDGGKALISEFLEGYYGAAAPFIQQYIDLIHAPGRANPAMKAGIYTNFDVEWLTPAIVAEAEEILRSAENAVDGDLTLLTRVNHVHSAIWYVLLKQGTQSKIWAETAARVGTLDVKDIAAKIAKVAVDNSLIQISEGDGITPFLEWAADYAALAAVAPPLPPELQGQDPSTYRLIQACQLNDRAAWWKRNPGASDGWVAQHPSTSWKINHQFSPYDEVTPGQRYKLFARIQTTSPVFDTSTAVKLGIYRATGGGGFSKYVTAQELSDGQFHTFELGEFTAEMDSGQFWMALNSNSAPPVNLDCIWLVKVP